MAKTSAPPELISEHGLGQVTVKAHSRKTPNKKPPKAGIPDIPRGPAVATGTPPSTVDEQVTAAQLPERQSIEAAQKASADAAKAQAVTTQGYYAALANALKSIGPATQAGYQSAAADTSAFGKGFSDGLAHVQSQTQDESTNIAGLAGGQAQQAPGGAPDALYALGGYIPATGFEREGAAFGAAANMLPATAAGQGASTIAGIGRQQAIDQKAFEQKLTDLGAQVPGLRAQYQAQADAQQNATRSYNLAVAKANAENVYRSSVLQMQYIAATGVDPRTGKLTPKAQLAYDKAQAAITTANQRVLIAQQNADAHSQSADTATAKANGYYVGADGQTHVLPGFKLNQDGTVSKVSTTGINKWAPGQPVLSSVGKMRVDGYDEAHIAKQLKKWHPNWTNAQIAATLKGAPKLFGDMTKEQVSSLRARASSLRSGFTFSPKKSDAKIKIGGKTYKSGDKIPPIPYALAVKFLVSGGYSRADAVAMLNRFYPRKKK